MLHAMNKQGLIFKPSLLKLPFRKIGKREKETIGNEKSFRNKFSE
jgi:hypothetical protein